MHINSCVRSCKWSCSRYWEFNYSRPERVTMAALAVLSLSFLALSLFFHFRHLASPGSKILGGLSGAAFLGSCSPIIYSHLRYSHSLRFVREDLVESPRFLRMLVPMKLLLKGALREKNAQRRPFIHLQGIDDQKKSPLPNIPFEIFASVIKFLSIREIAKLNQVCKKLYGFHHEEKTRLVALQHLFPTIGLLGSLPHSELGFLSQEIERIQASFSEETINLFGGMERILSFPNADSKMDSHYSNRTDLFILEYPSVSHLKRSTRWPSCVNKLVYFMENPIVKIWGNDGTVMIAAHFCLQEDKAQRAFFDITGNPTNGSQSFYFNSYPLDSFKEHVLKGSLTLFEKWRELLAGKPQTAEDLFPEGGLKDTWIEKTFELATYKL